MLDLVLVRGIFVLILTISAYALHPFDLSRWVAAAGGAVFGLCIILFEMRLEHVSLKRLIGAACGSVLGIVGAFLMSLVLSKATPEPFLQVCLLLLMTYVGLIVGAKKGDMLNLAALGGIFGGEKSSKKSHKILDTSVIIDGRIADIAETGFLDGVLVIPQFVLRELQLVADSADSMKRNRGRRGLDILQRIQKMANLNVQIVEEDFPQIREVDMKLIELAKVLRLQDRHQRFQPEQGGATPWRRGAEHQRTGQLAETDRPARRDHARLHPEGRQGVQPGRRLPG